MSWRIDLNCDLGEGAGHDAELLRGVTSANICCGVHAGGPELTRRTILSAAAAGVGIGAHPGLGGRGGMGRQKTTISADQAYAVVFEQVTAMRKMTAIEGVVLRHVKPHGTLYNLAARDARLAEAMAAAVAAIDKGLILFARAGGELVDAGRSAGLVVAQEAFADRTYQADGTLTPRSRPRAFVHDPAEAAARAVTLVKERKLFSVDGREIAVQADTLCVHGDSPGAVAMILSIREALASAGIEIRRFGQP